MSSGLAGEAFVLLDVTGEVSASPPQVAMGSTSPIATQTPILPLPARTAMRRLTRARGRRAAA